VNGGMVLSCPDAIAKTIERYIESSNGNGNNGNGSGHVEDEIALVDPVVAKAVEAAAVPAAVAVMEEREIRTDMCPQCPDCGSMVDYSEGCIVCKSCGYSKCW
jgi:ribonucleoside-diphosphate reductase alpha chain